MVLSSQNSFCRRSGIDKRQFNYTVHIPERRSGKERRIYAQTKSAPISQQENSISYQKRDVCKSVEVQI